jgi:hypothetical protein
MKQDKDYLYIFFQNHQHTKWPDSFFSEQTLKDAKKVKNILKSELEACNHIGFVFYDNKWKLAELDYFRGGRIVRNITENDIKDFQIYPITKMNSEVNASIYDLFKDKLQHKDWFYSWRRYNFAQCIDYINNSNIQRSKKEILNLKRLGISILKKPQNAGWTCIETTFYILDQHRCNPFQTKLSPYELLIELHETHT